jgi:hypothetical protein
VESVGSLLIVVGVLFVAGALPSYLVTVRLGLRLARRGGSGAEWAGCAAVGLVWLASVAAGVGLVIAGALVRDRPSLPGGIAP